MRRRAQAVPKALAEIAGCTADELISLTERLQQLRTQLLDARSLTHPA